MDGTLGTKPPLPPVPPQTPLQKRLSTSASRFIEAIKYYKLSSQVKFQLERYLENIQLILPKLTQSNLARDLLNIYNSIMWIADGGEVPDMLKDFLSMFPSGEISYDTIWYELKALWSLIDSAFVGILMKMI